MEHPPFLIGKSTVNGPCSMAMLNNQRVKVSNENDGAKRHV
jgi:hypothetical protein